MKLVTILMVIILFSFTQQACRQTIEKRDNFDIRVDLVSPSQIKIIEESGAKILNIYPAYLIAKATDKQFNYLIEKKCL